MKKIIIFTLCIVLIPLFIIGLDNKTDIISKIKYGAYENKTVRVKRSSSGVIQNVPLEEYVTGVVAGEMPVSFSNEALKAQAVASRTYVLKKMIDNKNDYDVTDGTINQVYLDYDDLSKKWQTNYDENLKRVKDAVSKTKGEVLLYDNKIIDAMFFSTSNGYTENSEDVFSSSIPYLTSVDSKWDKEESPVFNTKTEVTKNEFLLNLGLDTSQNIIISDVKKTNTGRVKELTINGKKYKSSKIREAFNLKSTSFDIKVNSDTVTFDVYGFGHGVGMSQYGANGMAKDGYNYQDILKHYYKDCEIKKIN